MPNEGLKAILAVWFVVLLDVVVDSLARSGQRWLFTQVVGCLDLAGIGEFLLVISVLVVGFVMKRRWLVTGMFGGSLLGATFLLQKTLITGC